MKAQELAQALKLARLQSLQLVVRQVQVAQVGYGVECGVVEHGDLVGAQDQLL